MKNSIKNIRAAKKEKKRKITSKRCWHNMEDSSVIAARYKTRGD